MSNSFKLGEKIDGPYTWLAKPAASAYGGRIIFISDIGNGGSLWISDGSRWTPLGGVVVLASSAAPVVCPVDTTEDALATVPVPPDVMGLNGALRWRAYFSLTNNANAKAIHVRFSGIAGADYVGPSYASAAVVQLQGTIQNRGVTNSQQGYRMELVGSSLAQGSGISTTSAVDTTAASSLVITAQKAVGGDAIILESYIVELIVP